LDVLSGDLEEVLLKFQPMVLLASVVVFSMAMAEPPPPPQFDIDRFTVLLDLTDAQKPTVQQVLKDEQQTMQAEREQAMASGVRPTREEMKAKHEAMRQTLHTKLQSVLTPAQLTKLDVLMEPPAMRKPPQ
jgi:hypothetical protein